MIHFVLFFFLFSKRTICTQVHFRQKIAHVLSPSLCCILTLDQAINHIFSAQAAPVKISGRSHVLSGNHRRYEMIYADAHMSFSQSQSVSASLLRSVKSAVREPWLQRTKRPPGEDQLCMSHWKRRHKILKIMQSN